MTQKSFNPIDYHFEWTDSWYTWDAVQARKDAQVARCAEAKRLKALGHKVKMFTLKDQLITCGGIGSGHPEISNYTSVYCLNVS